MFRILHYGLFFCVAESNQLLNAPVVTYLGWFVLRYEYANYSSQPSRRILRPIVLTALLLGSLVAVSATGIPAASAQQATLANTPSLTTSSQTRTISHDPNFAPTFSSCMSLDMGYGAPDANFAHFGVCNVLILNLPLLIW